jgi:hypothetical protein
MAKATRKITNRIHATLLAAPASPLKPSTPAMSATTKKTKAQLSMWSPPFGEVELLASESKPCARSEKKCRSGFTLHVALSVLCVDILSPSLWSFADSLSLIRPVPVGALRSPPGKDRVRRTPGLLFAQFRFELFSQHGGHDELLLYSQKVDFSGTAEYGRINRGGMLPAVNYP